MNKCRCQCHEIGQKYKIVKNKNGLDIPFTMDTEIEAIVCCYCPEWISVKDRMPKHNEWVLAFNGEAMYVCWVDLSNHDYLFMFGMSSTQQIKGVTHWMPLPELPNENK